MWCAGGITVLIYDTKHEPDAMSGHYRPTKSVRIKRAERRKAEDVKGTKTARSYPWLPLLLKETLFKRKM